MRLTYAQINLGNFKNNIKGIKSLFKPETKLCVAVKANGYGNGAVQCAKAAKEAGADFLAIACVSEGIELRQNGIDLPLLMSSLCCPEEIPEVIKYSITPLIFDKEIIALYDEELEKTGASSKFPVHRISPPAPLADRSSSPAASFRPFAQLRTCAPLPLRIAPEFSCRQRSTSRNLRFLSALSACAGQKTAGESFHCSSPVIPSTISPLDMPCRYSLFSPFSLSAASSDGRFRPVFHQIPNRLRISPMFRSARHP